MIISSNVHSFQQRHIVHIAIFIPHHTIFAGLGIMVSYWSSMCLSLILFEAINKYQWIFTKLGMCIDFMEIWFGISNRQISPLFYIVVYLPHNIAGIIVHYFCLPFQIDRIIFCVFLSKDVEVYEYNLLTHFPIARSGDRPGMLF